MIRNGKLIKRVFSLFVFLFFNFSCESPKPADNEPKSMIETIWEITTPEEQGLKSSLLFDLLKDIQDNDLRIRSVIIIRNGHLVLESYIHPYDQNILHDIKSVSKSVISGLTGIALRENILKDLDQNVYDFFPEHSTAPKRDIRLKHLLMMASGLELDENGPIMQKIMSQNNLIEAILTQPVIENAGERFNYCTFNTHVMSGVLTKASVGGLLELGDQYLFEPMGINNVYWQKDKQGYYLGGDNLWLTPLDMAKFGYLYLNKGKWDNNQIIPEEWVVESIKNKFTEFNDSSYSGYGYCWWLDENNCFRARGFGGQIISVYPKSNMVVVFTGADNYQWETLSSNYIIPSISNEYPLTPDVTSQKLLRRMIRELKDPEPQLANPLPDIAKQISGKRFIFKKNDLNFDNITFWFNKDTECRMTIKYEQNGLDLAIGLDNLYRISHDMKWGMKPENNTLALRGNWVAENRFYIDFHEVGEPFYFDVDIFFNENEIRSEFVWQPFQMKFALEGKLE